jgi:hypothetical protein
MKDFFHKHETLYVISLFLALVYAWYAIWKQRKVRKELYVKHGFRSMNKKPFFAWTGLKQFQIMGNLKFVDGTGEYLKGEYKGFEIGLFMYGFGLADEEIISQSVVFLKCKQSLPKFILRPEKMGDSIAACFGLGDIDFKRHQKFSKEYFLQDPHKEKIRSAFNNKILDYFLENDRMSAESNGSSLLVFKEHAQIVDDDTFKQILDRACETYEMLLISKQKDKAPDSSE